MMGTVEGKKWPGTAAETKFAEYLVRTAGGHFVTVVRKGVGQLLGVRVPGQAFVVQELMEAASASTLESLQRENEALKQDRYDLVYAITGGEDAPGLLDSTPTSEIVEIAQNTHRSHSADIDRAEAAEAEVARLQAEIDRKSSMPGDHRYWEGRYRDEAAENEKFREALKPFAEYMGDSLDKDNHGDPIPDNERVGWIYLTHGDFRRARTALASTGGEHDAE